jgi:hypothetical protein
MTRRRMIMLTVVGLLGGALPSAARGDHMPTTLNVVGVLKSGATKSESHYSLRRLRDLRVVAWWNVPGSHVQRLELRAPDGSIYRRLSTPFTAKKVRHPIDDTTLKGTPVRTVVPVGGTWIEEYSLVGTWQINLYLDNSKAPIATYSLTLTP